MGSALDSALMRTRRYPERAVLSWGVEIDQYYGKCKLKSRREQIASSPVLFA